MKQLKFKGFTLIELLIVVAIIAILAAIAVPNFLEAQVRSKVSRAKTDMRTLATALEAYYVDNNTYSGSATDFAQLGITVNSMLKPAAVAPGGAAGRLTFTNYRPQAADGMAASLTTPIAYITSFPSDPFADTKQATFGYFNASNAGWIMWSYGPNTDEKPKNGEIQAALVAATWKTLGNGASGNTMDYTTESVYNPYGSNPLQTLLTGEIDLGSEVIHAYTYDPTNGTNSAGDVWRIKQ